MVSVEAGAGTYVRIVGHGLTVANDFPLSSGITISPLTPGQELSIATTMGELHASTSILLMERIASFSLIIEDPAGGDALARKAWNALWLFSLLALASRSPCISLYSVNADRKFTLANRNMVIRPLTQLNAIKEDQLLWAASSMERFDRLLADKRFQTSMRYYNNAHYLFDDDAKIMLLWAGIEGLLSVEAELSRRIALHAAILYDGDSSGKSAHFADVKKAYNIRSKVVHGTGADSTALSEAYSFASGLLIALLRKMVDLGRVPSASELDQLAAASSVS